METKNKLTDYWSGHGGEKQGDYAKLINIIHQEWSGLSVKAHKELKSLENQNLRDHMSDAELIFTALAEISTRQIAETRKAIGYDPNELAAKKGGRISGQARRQLEGETGREIVNPDNYLSEGEKRLNPSR